MIRKFDTYSEMMPVYLLYGLSCLIFEMSAISRYGGGFFGLNLKKTPGKVP